MSRQMESASRCHSSSSVTELRGKNINVTIAMNELVIIRFYNKKYSCGHCADIEKLAMLLKRAFPRTKKVVVGMVECNEEETAVSQLGFSRGCTGTVVFRDGQQIKQVYSHEPLEEIIFNELENPIKQFHDRKELKNSDTKKHLIIGYFDEEDMPEYDNFRRVAHNLKHYCQFYIRHGYTFDEEKSTNMRPPNQPTIVFRPGNVRSNDRRETFKGCVKNYDDLNLWAHKKCLVREMSSDNYEELSKEGPSLLTLIYNPANYKSAKDFSDIAGRTFMNHKHRINCVKVDGIKYSRYLREFGKTKKDLPIITHGRYMFHNFKDIYTPGQLRSFALDSSYWRFHKGSCHNVSMKEFDKSIHKRK